MKKIIILFLILLSFLNGLSGSDIAEENGVKYRAKHFFVKFSDICKIKPFQNSSFYNMLNAKYGVEYFRSFDHGELKNTYYVCIHDSLLSILNLCDSIENQVDSVIYCEPDYALEFLYTPNDTFATMISPNQFAYPHWSTQYMQIERAWDITRGDSNIIISTVDLALNQFQRDIYNNLWVNSGEDLNQNRRFDLSDLDGIDNDNNGYTDDINGWNFDSTTYNLLQTKAILSKDHGIWTAINCCATPDNNFGTVGTGFYSKHLHHTGHFVSHAVNAIDYAIDQGVQIMYFSWRAGSSPTIQNKINEAFNNYNMFIVSSAGNDGGYRANFPCNANNVFCVAGIDTGFNGSFLVRDTGGLYTGDLGTSFHDSVDISAPYNPVVADNDTNNPVFFIGGGTSFSGPLVAGVAALLYAHFGGITNIEVGEILKNSAIPIKNFQGTAFSTEYENGWMGAGAVHAYRALGYWYGELKKGITVFRNIINNSNFNPKMVGDVIIRSGDTLDIQGHTKITILNQDDLNRGFNPSRPEFINFGTILSNGRPLPTNDTIEIIDRNININTTFNHPVFIVNDIYVTSGDTLIFTNSSFLNFASFENSGNLGFFNDSAEILLEQNALLIVGNDTIRPFMPQVISSNTTFSGKIVLDEDVIIQPNVTLSISPGCTLVVDSLDRSFSGYQQKSKVQFFVRGKLVANGTASSPIVFQSVKGAGAGSQDWYGIHLGGDV